MMSRRTVLATAAAALIPAERSGASGTFRVPAEDAPHTRTFMQWPVSRKVYPGGSFLTLTQQAIARIANTISDFEPVVMLAAKEDHDHARALLSGAVDLWDIPTEDLWCRDSGPLFATDGSGLAVQNLNFNGWGGKQVHVRDGKIAARVAERLGIPLHDTGLTGEPGGLESNGQGTLIAHESSWVIANRNRLSRSEIEARLLAAYGAQKMMWAPGLKAHDITDYHIDGLARFVAPDHIVIQLVDDPDPSDVWQTVPYKTRDILAASKTASGVLPKMTVVSDPARTRIQSYDFVASYVNYYVCNGAVILSQFGDAKADAGAQDTLKRLYPAREVIALNVDALGELGGGIHCATQQQPKV